MLKDIEEWQLHVFDFFRRTLRRLYLCYLLLLLLGLSFAKMYSWIEKMSTLYCLILSLGKHTFFFNWEEHSGSIWPFELFDFVISNILIRFAWKNLEMYFEQRRIEWSGQKVFSKLSTVKIIMQKKLLKRNSILLKKIQLLIVFAKNVSCHFWNVG